MSFSLETRCEFTGKFCLYLFRFVKVKFLFQIGKKGCKTLMKEQGFYQGVRMLTALPFVPIGYIEEIFDNIIEKHFQVIF